MDINQRRQYIIDKVKAQGTVRISDISQELDITRETIRKDIYTLDKQGIIQAVRGGATASDTVSGTKYGHRTALNIPEKQKIAKNAIRFIRDGDSIFLDYGTTAFEVAEAIKHSQLKNITVITNSTTVLSTLLYEQKIDMIFLGGSVRGDEGSVSGPLTLDNIDNIYADVGFFGSGGVNLTAGITNHYFGEVEVSKRMMAHCRIKIVLADHTKFEKTALYKTADIKDIDVIITDNEINPQTAKNMRLADISFINSESVSEKLTSN
ncbi:DeoR/GlpR family DNA-binding transcription regulator [Loigolactobacillus coryniformis]|uniref:DeoR/GlpR family DNA-binding transcription regulator n=1 Tax=Loigolactobacillus coryniformis TaxID=1610 RepID=UPI00345D0EE1